MFGVVQQPIGLHNLAKSVNAARFIYYNPPMSHPRALKGSMIVRTLWYLFGDI